MCIRGRYGGAQEEDFDPNSLGFTTSDKYMALQVHPSTSDSVNLPGFSIDKLPTLNNPTASKPKALATTIYTGLEMQNQLEQALTPNLQVLKTGPLIGTHTFCNPAMISLPTDCVDGYAQSDSRSNSLLNSLFAEHAAVGRSSTVNPNKSVVRHPVQATASGILALTHVYSNDFATAVKHQAKVETLIEEAGPLDKPHECTQCGLRFRKRCNAVNHLKIVHEKLRPYKCAHCDRAFGKKSNKNKHEKLHSSPIKGLTHLVGSSQRNGDCEKQGKLSCAFLSKVPSNSVRQRSLLPPKMATEPDSASPVDVATLFDEK
eukprot:Plantae.Rhodophyta-Palmaria_palmata.ctg10166.p1 GENE.Plantae.Rhodophyta-Palmaria_palmata.ctg10166~~Plantae.Rhodophyta-Palmaria_palmata.ctg10166.p1  ORF type:complete len:317 (-),score=18.37 Plantae.Rhodophyta-Palmaria_palmata.ctg10166:182-1132(-)